MFVSKTVAPVSIGRVCRTCGYDDNESFTRKSVSLREEVARVSVRLVVKQCRATIVRMPLRYRGKENNNNNNKIEVSDSTYWPSMKL